MKVEALNDCKVIAICVYNIFILSAVGVTLSIVLKQDQFEVMTVVRSVSIVLATTVTLLIIFLSKVGILLFVHSTAVMSYHIVYDIT